MITDVPGYKVIQLKLTKIKLQKLEGLGLYYSIRKKRNDLIICLNDSTEGTAGNFTQVLILTNAKLLSQKVLLYQGPQIIYCLYFDIIYTKK